MNVREQTEVLEHQYLQEGASFSSKSRGRDRYEEPCNIRTIHQRDRDRILHSKSFRRLKHKTQVFLAPLGDHYRTRLTHTLEVSQLSRTIARALRLNEDLTDAIALGHDLGHTPFGHAGERALNEVCPYGFKHYEQSVRIVELLEKKGAGLNLAWETRDGIRNHRTSGSPGTLEGRIVRYCDKIAYINHDIDDAERAGILKEEDIPLSLREKMGFSTKERLDRLVSDVIYNSLDRQRVQMSAEMEEIMREIRAFMFANVYRNKAAKGEETKAVSMLQYLYEYYVAHSEKLPDEYTDLIRDKNEPEEKVVCDYIAGMTDQFAVRTFSDLFIPGSWTVG